MNLLGMVFCFCMNRFYFVTIIFFLLFSCSSQTKQGDLLEIPVDIHKNDLLSLQEIAEEITAIEFELTDESVFNPDYVQNIIISENEVFIAGIQKIYVFSKDGKFIRTIGSKGQGPGEYLGISKIALDKKNRRLFISSSPKILSYDINGNFLKETRVMSGVIRDINYINEELLLLVENVYDDNKEVYSRPTLYRLNDELRTVDSCTIMNYKYASSRLRVHNDFILKEGKSVFLYYGDFTWIRKSNVNLVEKVFSDTLYRIENKYIVPELKLKFINSGVNKFINLLNIYRSSRYIFAIYNNAHSPSTTYYFCYDTKTGKGYNMQDGFTDDINGIDKRVSIRPFNHDTEMFYYLHTHIKPGDLEEPNPTLYIGRLKK